jgi:uncharacterized protein (TIGR01244 family)
MRKMIVLGAVGALLAAAGLASAQESTAIEGVPNFKRLSAEIATAGQPTGEAYAELKKAGFKTILNLRPPEEGSLQEKEKVEALGLRYVNIPITNETITEEKVKLFSEVVSDTANKPLLIHCSAANRVGGLWYIHRALAGESEEKSLTEAKDIGLRSPVLEEIVRKYVETHRASK